MAGVRPPLTSLMPTFSRRAASTFSIARSLFDLKRGLWSTAAVRSCNITAHCQVFIICLQPFI